MKERGEFNFDETSRDRTARMAWLDGSSIEEDEQVKGSPPTFLLPTAEFSAECCDLPHQPAVFGITLCRIDGNESAKHYRIGSFEHVVLPPATGDSESFSSTEVDDRLNEVQETTDCHIQFEDMASV